MQVIVPMRVDVVQLKPGRPVGLELRSDLGSKLAANRGPDHDREAVSHEIITQASVLADKIGDFSGGQHWPVLDQCQVQSDPQFR